ncbi:MAG: right-handed parallel beta-helix repeat-containing protein [Pirellulales bacterium]|nr:right-handed parallel beta-helix repeat-containing protein [Pirellulales bacterium]
MQESVEKCEILGVGLFILGLMIEMVSAGDLNPPGPPTSGTMKTIDQASPRIAISYATTPGDENSIYKISQPGSYYLTGNITGRLNKHGIVIDAEDVCLDLCGFAISGVPNSMSGVKVKDVSSPLLNEDVSFVSIKNGTIRAFGENGIHICGDRYVHIEEVSFAYNGGNGLQAEPNSCIHLENVSFVHNTGHGILLGVCTNLDAYSGYASHNGGDGMHVCGDAYIHTEEVSFSHNGGHGMQMNAPAAKIHGHLEDVSFTYNVGDGLYINVNSCDPLPLEEVSFNHNGGRGLYVNTTQASEIPMEQVSFTRNSSHGAVLGMMTNVDAYGTCISNSNGGSGIILDGWWGICHAWTSIGNNGTGIQVGSGGTLKNCMVCGNTGDGILVASNCSVTNCTCKNNGTTGGVDICAGIHVTGSGNRIEGNHVIGNNIGINIETGGNLIIKNSATGNTTANYDIAGGNTQGPTVGGYISSDNPHANYDF